MPRENVISRRKSKESEVELSIRLRKNNKIVAVQGKLVSYANERKVLEIPDEKLSKFKEVLRKYCEIEREIWVGINSKVTVTGSAFKRLEKRVDEAVALMNKAIRQKEFHYGKNLRFEYTVNNVDESLNISRMSTVICAVAGAAVEPSLREDLEFCWR